MGLGLCYRCLKRGKNRKAVTAINGTPLCRKHAKSSTSESLW